jgi:hypothetical protein
LSLEGQTFSTHNENAQGKKNLKIPTASQVQIKKSRVQML